MEHRTRPQEPDSSPHRSPTVPSLIKWTGSKRGLANRIVAQFRPHRRYYEPFLGSGAVLYFAANRGGVAGDVYQPLVDLWRIAQQDPERLVNDYRKQWNRLQKNFPEYFYEVRSRFNVRQSPLDLSFLMRTCVNGIVRFNERGEFNNSLHLSRKGMAPERFSRIVAQWKGVLTGVRFVCQDYAETVRQAERGDFVYFDPPYAGTRQRYTESLDTRRFFHVLEELNHRHVLWALSFDGGRRGQDMSYAVPPELYRRRLLIPSTSAVAKVLSRRQEPVWESLYTNYD